LTDRTRRLAASRLPAARAEPLPPAGSQPDAPCPCGSTAYADCCGRWHAGALALQAPDAPALMRSRYSAFVLKLAPYLLATWHPDTRPATLDLDTEPGLRWLGLTVKQHQLADADHATVEFIARSKLGGRAHRLHETSRFVRLHGRWLYLDGDQHGG
jgi:SEC-C motif-containing protein